MLLEACGEEPTDVGEAGARIAGNTIQEHPESAEDLAHPLHVLTTRRREQRPHAAEERTHHLGEPVVHGRPQSFDAGRGGPGDRKLPQEALDAFN